MGTWTAVPDAVLPAPGEVGLSLRAELAAAGTA